MTEQLLFEKLGGAPTVTEVSKFLNETHATTWRRVRKGELRVLRTSGIFRISLKSLAEFLNADMDAGEVPVRPRGFVKKGQKDSE